MDQKKETPKTFKYSIWDTRTADDQPDMDVIAARVAGEKSEMVGNQQNEGDDQTR